MIQGYGVTADFDGDTLRLTATNSAARAALLGPKSLAKLADTFAEKAEAMSELSGVAVEPIARLSVDGDSVSIPRSAILSVELKDASMLTNGNLIVHTVDGKKYQAHFRRKQSADFAGLAATLQPS